MINPRKKPARIQHQLEFRFMGVKEVQRRKPKGFRRVYSLGSDFLGEEQVGNTVVFWQLDPKTLRILPQNFVAKGELTRIDKIAK